MRAAPLAEPPSGDERLLDYASGAAPEPLALLVATHLALCPLCRRTPRSSRRRGRAAGDPAPAARRGQPGTGARTARSTGASRPAAEEPAPGDPSLPRPLRDYTGGTLDALPWRRLGPIAEVQLLRDFPGFTTRLLRIRRGVGVPVHTHRGTELTLVLRGAFSDEGGHFARGDVEEADPEVTHRPVADPGEDCLCLAVTDAPLKLTSRLGRLLNPFLRI